MLATPDDVIAFWFADTETSRREWFQKDTTFDASIATRFGATIEAALRDELAKWHTQSPTAAVARLIVLDQFTRNAFRDTPKAFEGDALALTAAKDLIQRGHDLLLRPLERIFVYLPIEHSEALADQDVAVSKMHELGRVAPTLADLATWAECHRDVIARFGRFPHRNQIIGRETTPDEAAFLREPGSSF